MKKIQLNFRTKLGVIVGTMTVGLVLLIVANLVISSNVAWELRKIHNYYVPLIEVGPKLEIQFNGVMRGLQDAVAAHDEEALSATSKLNQTLIENLEKNAEIIYPGQPEKLQELKLALETNYSVAHDVSVRLLHNETGISVVNAMGEMQKVFSHSKNLLEKAILFDEEKLSKAFESVGSAQKTAEELELIISGVCLIIIIILSLWIGRGVLRSLYALTEGFKRFREGDFLTPIPIESDDELGEVAKNANLMSSKIRSLLAELKTTNKELESFSYSVAHDLRAPLRASIGFSNALLEDYSSILPDEAKKMLNQVIISSSKMGELINGLLSLSRITRNPMVVEEVNLSAVAKDVILTLQQGAPERKVLVHIEEGVMVRGDPRLLHVVLANLLGNAWKFTGKSDDAKIDFGKIREGDTDVYFVRDNGAGFDMRYVEKLFGTFQRLHPESEFEGTGIGLATVQRIILRHHGRIWARSEKNKGATFFFSLAVSEGAEV